MADLTIKEEIEEDYQMKEEISIKDEDVDMQEYERNFGNDCGQVEEQGPDIKIEHHLELISFDEIDWTDDSDLCNFLGFSDIKSEEFEDIQGENQGHNPITAKCISSPARPAESPNAADEEGASERETDGSSTKPFEDIQEENKGDSAEADFLDSSDLSGSDDESNDDSSNDESEDNIPRAPLAKGHSRRKASHSFVHDRTFVKRLGATETEELVAESKYTPMEFFKHYISESLLEQIAYFTNEKFASRHEVTFFTSKEEIARFIGMNFAMSVIRMPKMKMYWGSVSQVPLITNAMPRDRFFKLRANLKVVDDSLVKPAQKREDKLWKIRPIVDAVRNRCLELPRPQAMCVGESMIPFRDKEELKQYDQGNPKTVGLKCFVLASSTGTILDLELCQSKAHFIRNLKRRGVKLDTDISLGEAVVLKFTGSVPKGSSLYFDKYFTTPRLLENLLKHEIMGTGILKKSLIPENAQMKTEKEMSKHIQSYSFNQVRDDGLYAITQCYGRKSLFLASSEHSIEPESYVKRWLPSKKSQIQVNLPSVLKHYESVGGGVKIHDQLITSNSVLSKPVKWTVRAILHFLDIAVTNAWMEYKSRPGNKQTYLDFKLNIAYQLIKGDFCYGRLTTFSNIDNVEEFYLPKKGRMTQLPSKEKRVVGALHMPYVQASSEDHRRCRRPGCSQKCRVMCSSCRVFLCLNSSRNCFLLFHMGNEDTGLGQN